MKRFLGSWLFIDSFEYGVDYGTAFLENDGSGNLSGYIKYKEEINGEEPFDVLQEVFGEVVDGALCMKGVRVTDLYGNEIPDYNPNFYEGFYTKDGSIVGCSYDSESIGGFFTMRRGS